MKHSKISKLIVLLTFTISCTTAFSQIQPGAYFAGQENIIHELKVGENYLIHSVYERTPAKFIKTLGGFFNIEKDLLKVSLEFNSNFEEDGMSTMEIPYEFKDNVLTLKTETPLVFEMQNTKEQDLDGQWLFATRGPDEGQKRRGESNTRKTLKYLQDGRFQWIAYDTEGMQFKGSGGGSYSSQDGVYTENIEYFSRDNSRVGASLKFDYEVKGDDWHHTGNNSKGEPMYEIWGKRK